ncbi:MAG: 50S ribosomal protein L22 [Planctomycetota bacterium]|nr:50S ribosomal protein L22 [Planctomycetota bacterium]
MAWRSIHRYARMSARKVRLIADMVRGRDVQDALNVLKFSPNRAAMMISKVLRSAIANANEGEADVESLFVSVSRVDEGPVIKRIRAKDRGRAYEIRKRMCHIVIEVDQEPAKA